MDLWKGLHKRAKFPIFLSTALLTSLLAACTGIPPLVLGGADSVVAPAGPKVASLIANLKCELLHAANSTEVLPYYENHPQLKKRNKQFNNPRAFTLQNIFQEIEYVGQATFTLEVTAAGNFNPSATFSEYYDKAMGVFPATGAVLSVGGQLGEAARRYITINSSIDFSRLVEIKQPHVKYLGQQRTKPVKIVPPPESCNRENELGGNLGLKETLAIGLIAAAMNDLTAFPKLQDDDGEDDKPAVPKAAEPPSIQTHYTYGQISALVEFTIVQNANMGPTWTLRYFKGPGGSGLLNWSRQVKDTLVVTFVPVCIREKYYSSSPGPPYENIDPKPVEGTPAWANFLPPCLQERNLQDKINALAKAKINNDQIILQNSLRN